MTENKTSRYAAWRDRFIVEERYVDAGARKRLYVTAATMIGAGAVLFTIVLIGVVTQTGFHDFDGPVEAWFNERVGEPTTGVMIALAIVFGPVALPVIILVVVVVWVAAARHVWRPLLLAGGMLTGVVLAQIIARIVEHPRPPVDLMLYGADGSFSFPSGHVLGAADFCLIVAYLLASRIQRTSFTVAAFTVAIAAIGVQIFSRLYLGYHWISDTTASVALSLIIVGAVIVVDVRRTVRVPGERVEGAYSQTQRDGT